MAKKESAVDSFDVTGGEAPEDSGLVVNLADVEEDKGFEVVPRGVYSAVVDSVEFGYSQRSGNPMWTWRFEISDGEYAGRKLFFHSTFNEGGLPRTKKTLSRVAPELLEGAFSPEAIADDGVLLGKECQLRVDIRKYEGQPRNNVRDVLAPVDGRGF